MKLESLRRIIEQVEQIGPDRVVIRIDGLTVTTDLALTEWGIVPYLVFVRRDGRTLGAPCHLVHVAEVIWDGEWVHSILVNT